MKKRMSRLIFGHGLALALGFAPLPADAAGGRQLQMNRSVIVRQADAQTGVLQSSGYLAPGAVVRIPSHILARHQSESNALEAALMDWLSNSGELRSFTTKNGEIKKDFFFPVEVVDAKKSKGLQPGAVVYAPIRFLARMKGVSMVVDADPEMATDPEAPSPAPVAAVPQRAPAGINSTPIVTPEPVFPSPQDLVINRELVGGKKETAGIAFLPYIQPQLQELDKRMLLSLYNRKDTMNLAKTYESSCPGKFEDFKQEVARVAQAQKVPVELLISIMHMESAGRCAGIKKPMAPAPNIGLFQVNLGSTTVQRCTPWQIAALQTAKTMKQLRDGSVRCLENPVTNLEEAAAILRQKYAAVNTQKQPEHGRWDLSNPQSHDDWRKALAAYNGGQSYVFQAHNDIVAYNKKNGTSLDPNSWENRRMFFFRGMLDRNLDQKHFDNPLKFKRSLKYAMINIAYVETIAGREEKPKESQYALVMQWVRTLYSNMKIRLAEN